MQIDIIDLYQSVYLFTRLQDYNNIHIVYCRLNLPTEQKQQKFAV